MSKIFEALNRGQGALPELILPMLEQEQPAAIEGRQKEAAVYPPLIEAPPPPRIAPEPAGLPAVRTLQLRIPAPSPLLPFDDTHWHASEQYRIARTKIIQHPRKPRMIVVSSAGPRDGKSVSAINLAGALSLKNEGAVLLVDADFRRSAVHVQLGIPPEPGLAGVLAGACPLEEALVRAEQLSNLYIIPAGSAQCNPAELLDSSAWLSLCATFRTLFRYIIVDSPPIAAVTDYDLIQASCDGVIMVMRPDHTNRNGGLKALEMVPKEKLIGVLLNCVKTGFLARYMRPHYQNDQGYGKGKQ